MRTPSPRGRPRTVFALRVRHSGRHECASQEWVASRLARLLGWQYGGVLRPGQGATAGAYYVPDDTLTGADCTALGIHGEDDLFGGVVPHAFVATKVITHGLFHPHSPAPAGWSSPLAAYLAGAVLPGWTLFDPAEIETAGLELLSAGGRIRLKLAQARGGNGQYLVASAADLRQAIARLDPQQVRSHGLVVEQNLEQARTFSVGELHVGGHHLAYLGSQHQVTDREGVEVYGGSRLRVAPGRLGDIQALARDPAEAAALEHVRRYDAAVEQAYPGFFASRRNYDVVAGLDPQGRPRCAVLEQSWRLGGASPAEVAALAHFLANPSGAAVEVSCHELHDPAQAPPPGTEVHFHDPASPRGPVLKYARVGPEPLAWTSA